MCSVVVICMQVFFLCIYFPAYRHRFATELGFALVMPPMDKIPPSYPNSYSLKIKLYIIDLRYWTRISDLILPSWLKLLSFFFLMKSLCQRDCLGSLVLQSLPISVQYVYWCYDNTRLVTVWKELEYHSSYQNQAREIRRWFVPPYKKNCIAISSIIHFF